MNSACCVIAVTGGIVYLTYKNTEKKKQKKLTEKRVSLISDTKVSQQVNNRNNVRQTLRNKYGKGYPSSSRLRYNRKRYLAPIVKT